jgi:hypothetical protein
MWCRSFVLLPLALIVAGCTGESGAAHKPPTAEEKSRSAAGVQVGAAKEPATPTQPGQEVAPKPVIYSASDLAKVLDCSTLPALEGTRFGYKWAASVSASRPGSIREVSAFYQKTFLARGWELMPYPGKKTTEDSAVLRFGKNGHLVGLACSQFNSEKDKKPQTLLTLNFCGNLDTRTLPSPPGKRVLFASQDITAYLAEDKVADVLSWAVKSLTAQGWQQFTSFLPPVEETDEHRTLTFRKQGYALTVYIGIHPVEKKTHFQYMVSALSHELPTPGEATKVQFDDVKWQMSCEVPGDWKTAADFYQKAMPSLGYKPLSGEAPQPTYWNLRFGTDAGDVINVQVSSKNKQVTKVDIFGVPAAALEAIKRTEQDRSKK